MSDVTHYELLGVDADAPKDEIRAAYQDKLTNVRAARAKAEDTKRPSDDVLRAAREEEARLRTAWQVLSDPIQRERYDGKVGVGVGTDGAEADDVDEDEDEDEEVEERGRARDRTPARRSDEAPARSSMPTVSGLEIPTSGRRTMAAGIDCIAMLALWFAVVYGVILGLNLKSGVPVYGTQVGMAEFLIFAYLMVPTWRRGQTVGQRQTHTMVVDRATGGLPDPGQVLRRYIIPAFSFALLGPQAGALIALFYGLSFLMNRDQVSLADRLAKTAVVIARYRPERYAPD